MKRGILLCITLHVFVSFSFIVLNSGKYVKESFNQIWGRRRQNNFIQIFKVMKIKSK